MLSDGNTSIKESIVLTKHKKKKRRREYEVELLLPASLDLNEIIQTHPPRFKYFKVAQAAYFIHLIAFRMNQNKHKTEDDGFVNFSSLRLKKKFSDYKNHLAYLEHVGIIEIDHKYFPSKRTKRYRLADRYNDILTPITFRSRAVYNALQQDLAIPQSVRSEYSHVGKWLKDLRIDAPAAIKYITRERNEDERDPSRLKSKFKRIKGTYVEVRQSATAKFISAYNSIRFFASLGYRGKWSVDKAAGRLHSPLTNLRSGLRQFVTYKGQSLESVDISSSQPFFMLRLFKFDFWFPSESHSQSSGQVTILDLYDYLKDTIIFDQKCNIKCINEVINDSISFLFMLQKTGHFEELPDTEGFKEAVLSNSLYDSFGKRLQELDIAKKKCSSIGSYSRERTKSILFMTLYSHRSFFNHPKAAPKREFSRAYPTIFELINICQAHDNSTLPRLLQAIEAQFILKRVCVRITKERPELPLFTIHDSIATVAGNSDYLEKVIKEESAAMIGYSPNLKREPWT